MMKKYLLLILFLVAFMGAPAQAAEKVRVDRLSVERSGETAAVSFTAGIDPKAAVRGMTVIYAPVITDGTHSVSLPAIVVQRKRAETAWERHEWIAGSRARFENGVYAKNGETVSYRAEVPFQQWMHDARIEVETVTAGGGRSHLEIFLLAENILPATAPEPLPEPEPEIILPEPTVVEALADALPFVIPASDFDPAQPIKFYDDERDNSLTVYYKINSYVIEPDYADNRQTLTNLLAAIDIIRRNPDAKVERVVVAGFASPEGPFELNDRLAWERAVSVKEYVLRHTDLQDRDILLFNGSADWRGLRMMVEKDRFVPAKQQVLDIIDFQPIWDSRTQTGRITTLRNLNGGESYRYLVENIFPKLRNGAFIRVYYDEK